jgi:hypothetical protein
MAWLFSFSLMTEVAEAGSRKRPRKPPQSQNPAPAPAPAPTPAPVPSAQTTKVLSLATSVLSASAGDTLNITTRFQAAPMNQNYAVFIHFVDSGGVTRFQGDYLPTGGTSQWSGLVSQNRSISIPAGVADGTYLIKLGLYEYKPPYMNRATLDRDSNVSVDSELRYTVGTLTIGGGAAEPLPVPEPAPVPQPEPVPQQPNPSQTQVMTLSTPSLTGQAGGSLSLTTRFNAVPMSEDYGVFIHFVNSGGGQPTFSHHYMPGTSQWSGSIESIQTFTIPASVPAGTYSVRMGLYRNVAPYATRAPLDMGAGVTVDGELRYIVGSLKVSGAAAPPPPSSTPSPSTPPPPPSSGSGPAGVDGSLYSLTFNDDFNSFNTAVWNEAVWYETSDATKNFTVENGLLKIWPQRNAAGQFKNRTIDTDGKYYQTYGFFEIEAKLPYGRGTWPAFWLFNHIGDRRPEIDIMEAYAGGGPNSGWSDANLHPTAYGATVWITIDQLHGFKMIQTPDLSAAFHKYGLKWEPNRLTFYFDGKEMWTTVVAFQDPMYLMLDLWFGSASGTPDNSTPQGKGNSYEVNYVRAWKLK